ncbi:type II toxin-antitoxin system YhaV family toxin [Caenispirillum bisanense]|uniref:Toxin YhaV n=1 Tax=Caenispirillum bisanense TaxID=414052 RepID=A0A286G1U1_9PROT|nr:type II toxin-antitoxin system YhaV family toxin [Caenispirillum bisanense]SOD89438.1 toxin YhaV [Caenispirillum bisanense]
MRRTPLTANGWRLAFHPLLLDHLEDLLVQVDRARARDPEGWMHRRSARMLAGLVRLILDDIPSDPTRDAYRQGNTLGGTHRHWFRAKLFQRYRLFFRYRAAERIIVYAWVNDDDGQRAAGSRNDPYAVFRHMLSSGRPPDDWETLLTEASEADARARRVLAAATPPESV